jgi:hypothetical protein
MVAAITPAVAALCRQHFRKTRRFQLSPAAIQLGPFHPVGVEQLTAVAQLGCAGPHLGQLRIRIGAVGYHQLGDAGRRCEQGVLYRDPGMGICIVGELQGGTDIAGRQDARVGAAQSTIHADQPPVRGLNTDHVQIQIVSIGTPSQRHQNLIGLDLLIRRDDPRAGRAMCNALDGCIDVQRDAVIGQGASYQLAGVRMFQGQYPGRHFE